VAFRIGTSYTGLPNHSYLLHNNHNFFLMIKVIIKGTVTYIGPVVNKDSFKFQRISIIHYGYPLKTDGSYSDQTYEITVANGYMELLEGIKAGDKVEITCFLNSNERSDGDSTWHILNLNLRTITKIV
jgi:hypothetical protein